MKFLKHLWALLTHNDNGKPSSTKFWQSVGYIVASWVMIILTLHDKMEGEYFLIYIGAITAARSFQNYLVARGGGQPPEQPRPPQD